MNSIIRKEVLKMIDQFREFFKNSGNTWLKVISMIAAILYVIVYMCSCAVNTRVQMTCEQAGDSVVKITYTAKGQVRK